MELWRGARSRTHYNDSVPLQGSAKTHWEGNKGRAHFTFCNRLEDRATEYAVVASYEDAIRILELIRYDDPRAAELLGDPQDLSEIKKQLGLIPDAEPIPCQTIDIDLNKMEPE